MCIRDRVYTEVFDRFDLPSGQSWDKLALLHAVTEAVTAAQGRINLRNPGILVLSPGGAPQAFDRDLHEAVTAAVQSLGRKNRGLIAVASVMLRLQATPDPHAVRLGYGLFPVANRRFAGDVAAG